MKCAALKHVKSRANKFYMNVMVKKIKSDFCTSG